VGVLDLPMSKPTESKLHHGPVVQDLGGGVTVMHGVLKVGHQHQISRCKPVVMNGVEVDMTEDSTGSESVSVIFAVDVLAEFVQHVRAGLLTSLQLACLLINNLRIKLEVNMLNPLQKDSADFTCRSSFMNKFISLVKDLDKLGLVLESVNVLITVSITVLENFDEFLI